VKPCSLICGGTGLSPMSQILREIFYSKRFDIDISMIYACPRPDCIPYYELLHRKAASHPNFKLTCTVDTSAGLPWDEVRVAFPRLSVCRHGVMLLGFAARWVCDV
jgi:ferredoxin-NADP reductase